MPPLTHSLPDSAYHTEASYQRDRDRVFFRHWLYAGRAERLADPGSWLRVEIAGESVLRIRGRDDVIRGFYNVCRHRGSRLLDEESGRVRGVIRCPYHSWCYRPDGSLASTPMLEEDEVDRDRTGLWPVHVAEWEGFVFVNLADDPVPLLDQLADQTDDVLSLARFKFAELRLGHLSRIDVAANWKIVLENYNECLHCPTVHPELVSLVPAYRQGVVTEPGRSDGGVSLADGRSTLALDPRLRLPLLPGVRADESAAYFGAMVYPSMFLDVDGTTALATAIFPTGPDRCTLVTEYLFHPDALADPGFDPTSVVEFNELVTRQDNDVCERVQQGVSSRCFSHGLLSAKDSYVIALTERYLRDIEGSR